MIIHDHWSCWSCMKFVDHAMIRYWSCMISVDHAMKGCWSCMKSVDHAMKGCWSYMMINDHCHERLLIIHDQHWSVYHIVTTRRCIELDLKIKYQLKSDAFLNDLVLHCTDCSLLAEIYKKERENIWAKTKDTTRKGWLPWNSILNNFPCFPC